MADLEKVVEDLKKEIEDLKEDVEAKYEDIMDLINKQVDYIRNEFYGVIEDATGFFEKNKVAVLVVGGLLAVGAIALLII
jgi:hypothetical protein